MLKIVLKMHDRFFLMNEEFLVYDPIAGHRSPFEPAIGDWPSAER